MKIGIIGYGVVGRATHNMLEGHDVKILDPHLGYNHLPIDTDACFVCIPTPTKKGKRDHGILEGVLKDLNRNEYKGMVIIKSTVSPYYTDFFQVYNLNIMVAPEFLNQFEPYAAFEKHLIGVTNIYQAELYRNIFKIEGYGHKDLRTTSIKTAVMAKSVHNCFGATKVAFFNEVYDACEKDNLSYREVMACIFSMNDNIHPQYTRIGVDGKRGFGGFCFGKDSIALAGEYDMKVLSAAIETNKKYRKEYMESME